MIHLNRFLAYYRPHRRLLLAVLACAVLVAAAALAIPLCARYITQTLLVEHPPDVLTRIGKIGVFMLGLVAVQGICTWFVDYQGHKMGALMEADMRRDLFAHYQTLSFGFYDEQRTGQLMSRLTHDLFWVSELAHHGPEDMLIMALKFTGAFVIMLTINVSLTLIIFVFVPVMAVYAWVFNRRMHAALARSRARVGDINAQAEDTLAGIRVVKSFANEALEAAKFHRENRRFVESRSDGYRSQAYFYGGMEVFTQLFTVVVIGIGAVAIVDGSLDLPELVTFLLYVASLTDPVNRAVNLAQLYQQGITGFNRFAEMMAIQPTVTDAPNAIELDDVRGSVTFDKVHFRYGHGLPEVIRGVSLHIKAGEYVALVGASGAGKSTLCKLIPRFYDVTGSEIRVDDMLVQNIRQASLRRHIGVVQQDVYLFAGTIAENISYGRPDATHTEIVTAAKQANAHEFITALPYGYDTDVGQRGVKLSGGQQQRLSIARVFLKNPPIIIFDEATSALDNESEAAVQAAMDALAADRTVIAHRLSTVRNARRIIVMADGAIVEEGTHDDLIVRGGVYARLHGIQIQF